MTESEKDRTQEAELTFEHNLRLMPDFGSDDDFVRIEGEIRDIDLSD